MEESNSQPDNPPTIIDLDSPDDHDLSDPNYTEDHMVDEEIEEEKSPVPQTIDLDSSGHMIDEEIEEEVPQTIDSNPWAQVLSEPNYTEDHVGDEEIEDENEEIDESRDSDRRNLRAQRTADSPHGQHDEEESMPRDTDTSKSRPGSWSPPDNTKETSGGNNKSSRSDTRDPDAKTNRREKVGRSSDAWGQQPVDRAHRSRSISPRDGHSRSHRNRSRTRSRSRSRSPSGPRRSNWRSPVGGNDRAGDWRSPVGRGNDNRSGEWRSPVGRGSDSRSGDWKSPVGRGNDCRTGDWRSPVNRGGGDWRSPVGGNDRRPAGGAQPCRDFMAGRCRRGPQCRFLHPDEREGDNNRDREREKDNRDRERGRGSSRDRERDRDRYPPPRSERDSNKDDIYDSRGQSEYSHQLPVSQGRKANYDEPGYNYSNRSSERCFDFTRGRCKRGADCRFIHEEASGQGRRERDERERERGEREERESYRGGGNYEEREGANSNLSRAKKEEICKFYLEGRCGRGQSCRFSHEENNSVNESSWSDSNKRDSVPSNQYMVPVTETVPVSDKIENQYNAPVSVQVLVPSAPVMNPYMGVNPNPNPNLQGYNSNLQNVPAINPNQMTQSLPPPPPVNPPLPPGNPPNPNTNPNPNPNPGNLVTTEQAANITDISAYLSQILATNNPTIPVPVQVPVPVPDKPDNPVLHESPITPPVEMETNSETKKDDPPNPNPNPNPNNPKVKEGKGLKLFKCALVEVVKDLLKPSWKEGQLSREVHKTIVKKVCEKVIGTLESLPPTQEKIDVYLSHSKPKLAKLVQAYVEKFVKAQS